ncbi:hypothetical protein GGR58DRAFT_503157 [Xylaria digitata]|nr:hypothetical protein GGR58DRAFT_503157 [Xylaria digitata]
MRIAQILTAGFTAYSIPFASANDSVGKRSIRDKGDKAIPPPGPVQDGAQLDNCAAWALATPGITCDGLAQSQGIKVEDLTSLNPQLRPECSDHIWAGYYYCVGLAKNLQDSIFQPVPKIDHCKAAVKDQCASAVLAASEAPAPMVNWCERYLTGPTCTEKSPEGIFSSYNGFPKQAMASSLCAYPSAPPAAPRISLGCYCFNERHLP